MNNELLIVHANCQGEPLADFLRRVPEVAARWEVRLYTNYVREPIGPAELARCTCFLYQPLGPAWGELASAALLARLPAGARTLAFPSMFLGAYWPFWGAKAAWDYPDTLLDRLLDEGAAPAEAVRLYLRGNLVAAADPAALWAASLARERAKQAATPIHHVDAMLARFRERMIFNVANHPGHDLLCWLGRRVLEELHLPEPIDGVEAAMPELHPEFRMPVHPKVAEILGLEFADADTRYPVYGRDLTFEQYALEYAVARADGIEDLIDYFRARGQA
ncbi:MAG: WcbI family polysaccharide biosynthesis putative acetyltransferase [Desulfovibrionaceae bacterium]